MGVWGWAEIKGGWRFMKTWCFRFLNPGIRNLRLKRNNMTQAATSVDQGALVQRTAKGASGKWARQ